MWIRGRAYFETPSRLSDLLFFATCALSVCSSNSCIHPTEVLEVTKTSSVGTSVLLQPSSAPDSSAIECAVCRFVGVPTWSSLNRFTSFPILLERGSPFLRNGARINESLCGQTISMETGQTISRCLSSETRSSNITGLDLGLLSDRVLRRLEFRRFDFSFVLLHSLQAVGAL